MRGVWGGRGGVGGRTPRAGRRWGGTHPCGVGGSDGFMGFMEFIGRCGGRCGTASPSPGLRGGVGGGGQEVGAGRAAGRHPLPPPPPPRCGEVRSSRGHIPPPPRLPALGLGVLPGTAPPARACPAASPGGAPARPQRCGTEAGSGTPPLPLPTVSPLRGSTPRGMAPPSVTSSGHPWGRGSSPPPNPPIPPIGDSGAGEPAGTSPAPRGCPPPPRVFPTLRAQRDAFGSPPAPRGGGGTRAAARAALSAVPGGGGGNGHPHIHPRSPTHPGGLSARRTPLPARGVAGRFSAAAPLRAPCARSSPPPLRPPPPTKMRPRAPPGPGPALTVPSGPRWPWRRRARAAARKLRGIFSPRATPAP